MTPSTSSAATAGFRLTGLVAAAFTAFHDDASLNLEILLAGLASGADGAIGSTFNYSAPVYNRVMAAFERGDMAEAMRDMARARECVRILIDFGGLPAGKAMLKLCGIDCGPARLPLRTLSAQRTRELRVALEASGWDEIRNR